MSKTTIEWVARPGTMPESWNPIGGCEPISEGCYNCWAARMAGTRLSHHPRHAGLTERREDGSYKWTGEIRLAAKELVRPLRWKKPRTVFVCSMSDLFHKGVPGIFIKRDIWNVMVDCPQHAFLLLTKRPERMLELLGNHTPWPKNIWAGVTAENQAAAEERIPPLLEMPAARFLSLEPLLGPVNITDQPWWDWRYTYAYWKAAYPNAGPRIDWVIVGGESGPGARPLKLAWIRDIIDQCKAAHVPVFIKQLGTAWAQEVGAKSRKGADPAEWPADLRVREFPR